MDRMRKRRLLERDLHFAQRGFTAERLFVAKQLAVRLSRRRRRQSAIHIVLEQGLELRLALAFPLLLGRYARSVEHYQRIRKLGPRRPLINRRKISRGNRREQHGNHRECKKAGHDSAPKDSDVMSVMEVSGADYLAGSFSA